MPNENSNFYLFLRPSEVKKFKAHLVKEKPSAQAAKIKTKIPKVEIVVVASAPVPVVVKKIEETRVESEVPIAVPI